MISVHSTRASSERGLASLEFLLAIPVLVFIVLLIVNVAMLAMTRLDVLYGARSAAFESANGLSAALRVIDPPVARNGEPIFTSLERRDNSATRFLPWLRNAGDSGSRSTVALDTRNGGQRVVSSSHVATASTFFFGDRPLGVFGAVVEAEFAATTEPLWLREDMVLGYDRQLDSIRGLNRALPDAFPRTP